MADDLEDEWWLESSENASKKKSNEGVTGKWNCYIVTSSVFSPSPTWARSFITILRYNDSLILKVGHGVGRALRLATLGRAVEWLSWYLLRR